MKPIGIALAAAQIAVMLGALAFAEPADIALPPCQYEDGNTDGMPCMWTDPDTGRAYYVESENYQ